MKRKQMSTERAPINVVLRGEQSGGQIAVIDNVDGAGFQVAPTPFDTTADTTERATPRNRCRRIVALGKVAGSSPVGHPFVCR